MMNSWSSSGICTGNKKTHFMQVLFPDFLDTFGMPVAFVDHLEEQLEGSRVETVVLITEDKPNRHWVVKVEGGRYFKQGWQEFCLHHQCRRGDFLVFRHQQNLLFYVSIYDPITACERPFTPPPVNHLKGTRNRNGVERIATRKWNSKDAVAHAATNQGLSAMYPDPVFRVTLTESAIKKAVVYPPMAFVKASGLFSRNCNVILVDEQKRPWEMKLDCRRLFYTAYLHGGWRAFQNANGFMADDVLGFVLLKSGTKPVIKCTRV